jgi:hypothetical protein
MAARPVAYLSVALALITQAEAQAPKRSQDLAKAPSQADSPGRKAPEAQALRESIKPRPGALLSAITLGDVGFGNGFRFANLAGRRELFVPLPQGADIAANELVLVVDDVSAHEARRSLEILLNDRRVASIALEEMAKGAPCASRSAPPGARGVSEVFLPLPGAATRTVASTCVMSATASRCGPSPRSSSTLPRRQPGRGYHGGADAARRHRRAAASALEPADPPRRSRSRVRSWQLGAASHFITALKA